MNKRRKSWILPMIYSIGIPPVLWKSPNKWRHSTEIFIGNDKFTITQLHKSSFHEKSNPKFDLMIVWIDSMMTLVSICLMGLYRSIGVLAGEHQLVSFLSTSKLRFWIFSKKVTNTFQGTRSCFLLIKKKLIDLRFTNVAKNNKDWKLTRIRIAKISFFSARNFNCWG